MINTIFSNLVKKCRSFRRFEESHRISSELLTDFIDLSRYTASSRNAQFLKYLPAVDLELNQTIFPCLRWAGYLKEWNGPPEGERPAAYIIICGDKNLTSDFSVDAGIVAATILYAATEQGLGGCMIGSFDKRKLESLLRLPTELEILLVLALGKPAEESKITEAENGNIKYFRDENGTHFVPKRPLSELILQVKK